MPTIQKAALLLFVAICCLAAAGCGGSNGSPGTAAKDHSAGQGGTPAAPADGAGLSKAAAPAIAQITHLKGVIRPSAPPRRIASTRHPLTDQLIALGLTPTATVRSPAYDFPQYLEPFLKNAEIIGEQGAFSVEKLLSTAPDLIVADTTNEPIYEQLEKIAPTVMLNNVSAAARWQDSFIETAKAFGLEGKGNEVIARYDRRAAEVAKAIAGKTKGKTKGKTLMVLRTYQKDIRYYGDKQFKDLYDTFGFVRPSLYPTNPDVYFDVISMEKLPEINPDIILVINDNKEIFQGLEQYALWKQMRAVTAGQVHEVDSDSWFGGKGPNAATFMLNDLGRLFAGGS